MKYRLVSGTSLAIAAIALAMNGAASAKKAASVECNGINACKGKRRLQDRKQRVQWPEFLQGPWMAASQVGGGVREKGWHGRLIDYQAGGRLYRTDAGSLGCFLGFAAG